MANEVVVEQQGPVQVITINRPEQKNALDARTSRGIADAVDELDATDDLRAGVLTGAGSTFCAGMDLKAFLAGERPSIKGRGLAGITMTPPSKPLVAAVEGWALAGGFELLLACDLIVAAETARFGVPEVKRSLVAGAGAALLLPRRVPFAQALELLLTGEPISAARAAEIGLVNRVVPEGDARESALELAGIIGRNGPLALTATKQIAYQGQDWSMDEAWERQAAIVEPVMNSEDAREGAAAFAEKREPVWKAR